MQEKAVRVALTNTFQGIVSQVYDSEARFSVALSDVVQRIGKDVERLSEGMSPSQILELKEIADKSLSVQTYDEKSHWPLCTWYRNRNFYERIMSINLNFLTQFGKLNESDSQGIREYKSLMEVVLAGVDNKDQIVKKIIQDYDSEFISEENLFAAIRAQYDSPKAYMAEEREIFETLGKSQGRIVSEIEKTEIADKRLELLGICFETIFEGVYKPVLKIAAERIWS